VSARPRFLPRPRAETRADAAPFTAQHCLNCGDPRLDAYCPRCGQGRVGRLGAGALWSETWTRWRVFEFSLLQALWQVLRRPGLVALEYVQGARRRHVHPLKLWLFLAALQLLVLQRSGYLDAEGVELAAALALIQSWSNFAFAIGGLALWLACVLVMKRGYTLAEHAVLAAYAHSLVLAAATLLKLPVLVWRSPEFLGLHQSMAPHAQDLVGALALGIAARQFFGLRGLGGQLHLALLVAIFLASKWLLLRGFGHALSAYVRSQL
jgi:hypothetical protein